MTGIQSPEENDVPMGRGGFVNSHRGHRRYLKMVQDKQLEYVKCRKSDKMEIAWGIVRELRAMDPPARFLRKDAATGLWSDVGDKKFREKVSQALREHQPFIKAVIECKDPETELEPLSAEHRPCERSSCWDNDTEQPPQSSDFETPSLLVSADKRRAFMAARNETNIKTSQALPAEEDLGVSLSEFSVSQGPSFPDFDEALPASRRNSSGLECLFEILANESNAGLSLAEVNYCSLDNEKISIGMDDPYAVPEAQEEVLKRSSSSPENDCYSYSSPAKRCVLSRDKSEVSRNLKEAYCNVAQPEFTLEFEGEGPEMESLLSALEKSFPFPDHY